MRDLEERDRIRNFQPPITGYTIMQEYDIAPCAILGEIPNEYEVAQKGSEFKEFREFSECNDCVNP